MDNLELPSDKTYPPSKQMFAIFHSYLGKDFKGNQMFLSNQKYRTAYSGRRIAKGSIRRGIRR